MKQTSENIKALLRLGAPVSLCSDLFRFSELHEMVLIAASSETMFTLTVGDNLNFDEVKQLVNASHGFLHIKLDCN